MGEADGSGSFPRQRQRGPRLVRSLFGARGSALQGWSADGWGVAGTSFTPCPAGREEQAPGAGQRCRITLATPGRRAAPARTLAEHARRPKWCPEALGRGAESRIRKASLGGAGSQWDGPVQRG